MSFKDYALTPADNTELGDGSYIGPNMLRNKVRPAFQQIAADGKELADSVLPDGARAGKFLAWDASGNPVAASGTGADPALRTDLATAGGAGLVSTASGQSVDAAFRAGLVAASYFGDLASPTEANATIADAFDYLGAGGTLAVQSDIGIGATPVVNPGVQIVGGGAIYYDRGAGRGKEVQNRRGRDAGQKVLGREYLNRFWNYLARFGVSLTASVWLAGDSLTASYVGPILQGYLAGIPGVGSTVNNAIGGTTIEHWRTGTGAFAASGKALADWIAAPTDLLYIAFGINTPYFGGSPESFATSLEQAVVSVRAVRDSTQTSIFVVLPIASRDGGAMSVEGGYKRDEYFVYKLRALCEPLVDKYRICLYDQSLETPAADVDSGTVNPNATWLDAAGVHPIEGYKYFLAGQLFDTLVPTALRTLEANFQTEADVTPGTGFTLPNNGENMRGVRRAIQVIGDGYVGMTTPAVLTVGQTIATLPVGLRPARFQRHVTLELRILSPFARELISGEIDQTTGAIKVTKASTILPERVYFYAAWNAA